MTTANQTKALRSNPKRWIEGATKDQLLTYFPISQKDLNKSHKGNIEKYRKDLLWQLNRGSIVILAEGDTNEDCV